MFTVVSFDVAVSVFVAATIAVASIEAVYVSTLVDLGLDVKDVIDLLYRVQYFGSRGVIESALIGV